MTKGMGAMTNSKITEKYEAYGKPVGTLNFFIKFFMPVMALLYLYSGINVVFRSPGYSNFEIARSLVLAALAVFTAVTVRDLDSTGYYCSVAFLILWPTSFLISVLISLGVISSVAGDAVGAVTPAIGAPAAGIVAGVVGTGVGLGALFSLLPCLIYLIIAGGFLIALHKHKELFFKTTKQLAGD